MRGAGGAGRAGGNGDAPPVERHQQRRAGNPLEGNVRGVGSAQGRLAKNLHTWHLLAHGALKAIAQSGLALGAVFGQPVTRHLGGLAQPYDSRQILRAGAPVMLLRPSHNQRLHRCAAAYIEDSDSLRTIQLVPGDAQHIATDARHINRHFAGRLHSVGVKPDVGLGGDPPNLLDQLNHAGLIVGHHDRDQARIRTQRGAHIVGIHPATTVNGKIGHSRALRLGALAGAENGVMLDGAGDHVVVLGDQAEDGLVVALGATTVEDDLRWRCPQQSGD